MGLVPVVTWLVSSHSTGAVCHGVAAFQHGNDGVGGAEIDTYGFGHGVLCFRCGRHRRSAETVLGCVCCWEPV